MIQKHLVASSVLKQIACCCLSPPASLLLPSLGPAAVLALPTPQSPAPTASSIRPARAAPGPFTVGSGYTGMVSSPFPWQTPKWSSRPTANVTALVPGAATAWTSLHSTYPAEPTLLYPIPGLPPPTPTTTCLAHSRCSVWNKRVPGTGITRNQGTFFWEPIL